MTVRAAACMIVLALAVAGCARPAPAGDGTSESPRLPGTLTVHPQWESCEAATPVTGIEPDDSQAALSLPHMDDGFQPVAAVVCLVQPRQRPSGGSDWVAVEERADDVAALTAALRLPDAKPTAGFCTMEMPFVPWLALLDAQGRWVRPGIPTNACHKPRQEFRTAYEQLPTRQVTTRVLREIESDQAVASGCSQKWADMVWVAGQSGGGRHDVPASLAGDDAEVRVCVYRVPESEQGGGKPAGDFESGGKLPAGRWTAIRHELTTAAPATACSTPSSRFAVLHLPTGMVYAEADGCRRVLIEAANGPGALRQGTARLGSLLFER
ncbi:hypothetical protein [Micromonospora narathiwatensis]|uniref:Lipoprotein n=1 Tax=Micromonospora narathiwatensis TaxID=299146 RepID=A0A1A8ZTJ6_9ACTN|nr:hypothetical protein [Micromonospora narathiwatensis]SBT47155.1 hypothetical protein GA0070621_2822 [Micromonospora narathiwatensis]